MDVEAPVRVPHVDGAHPAEADRHPRRGQRNAVLAVVRQAAGPPRRRLPGRDAVDRERDDGAVHRLAAAAALLREDRPAAAVAGLRLAARRAANRGGHDVARVQAAAVEGGGQGVGFGGDRRRRRCLRLVARPSGSRDYRDHQAHNFVVGDVLHIDHDVPIRLRAGRDVEPDHDAVVVRIEIADAVVRAVERCASAGRERAGRVAGRVKAEPEQRRERTRFGRVGAAVARPHVGDLDVDRVVGPLVRRGRRRGERRYVVAVVAVVGAAACLGVRLDHYVRRSLRFDREDRGTVTSIANATRTKAARAVACIVVSCGLTSSRRRCLVRGRAGG